MPDISISASVGKNGVNRQADVKLVQQLINKNIGRLTPLAPLKVDGINGSRTIGAITEFQTRVVGMSRADGRVDPGGMTLKSLNQGATFGGGNLPTENPEKPKDNKLSNYRVSFDHDVKTPDSIAGAKGTNGLYESTVLVGGKSFRGSIFPDNMDVKGRIKDGTYSLYLGFHKRGGGSEEPGADDLEVRTQGFRATLIVNNDQSVPVISNNAGKKTSSAIHVHNGFRTKRYSDGCPTIHPDDWKKFISIFLDAFEDLEDWTSTSKYVGKKIGVLEVKS